MKNCLVFDLDGTLVDTAPDLLAAHNFVMRKHGFEEKNLKEIKYVASKGAAQMLIRVIDAKGNLVKNHEIDNQLHKKMTSDFISYYRENISKNSKIKKNVISLLEWCKNSGIICAICTNKKESLAIKLLKEINLYKYFDFISGADTFKFKKPDPRHLTEILDILEINKKNVIMVGDSETDSETALKANIPFILVEEGYTEKKIQEINHDYRIKDFEKIKEISKKIFNL
jgi:phosphoglycolate phosphatase